MPPRRELALNHQRTNFVKRHRFLPGAYDDNERKFQFKKEEFVLDATTATKPASCVDTSGNLPSCAPLATPYVPFQQVIPRSIRPTQAFIRGTLYPGLDLPFQIR